MKAPDPRRYSVTLDTNIVGTGHTSATICSDSKTENHTILTSNTTKVTFSFYLSNIILDGERHNTLHYFNVTIYHKIQEFSVNPRHEC